MALWAGLEKVLDRVLCAAGAMLGAQLPEFMQQYLQRLGGHLDEARRQLAAFAAVARQNGLTLEQYMARLSDNVDPVAAKTGGVIRVLAARVDQLAGAETALRHASGWTRPWIFLHQLDREIASGTWAVFRPAMPVTMEGLIYAAIGLLLIFTLYYGAIKIPLRHILSRWMDSSRTPSLSKT